MDSPIFVYRSDIAKYDLGDTHPLKPVRLQMTYELLQAYKFFERSNAKIVYPEPATREEVLTAHTEEYVNMVEKISESGRAPGMLDYGFGNGDNPPFKGMYSASLIYTGATMAAARSVYNQETRLAFNIGGGLHHAMPNRASGFCVFNDPVMAIKLLLKKFNRIAYLDIDAHHGDGVQAAFEKDNRVLTVSVHESGRTLFPGTGFAEEFGGGKNRGFAVNLPLAAGTGDDVYIQAFEAVVPAAIKAFEPQVIVAQLGADSHKDDPLAHLRLTTHGWKRVIGTIRSFEKPLVALGGGGYNLSSVCRLWAIACAELCGLELENEIPKTFARERRIYRLYDEQETTTPEGGAREYANKQIDYLNNNVIPNIKL